MKRGEIHPKLGVTEGNLKSQIRSALRKIWRNTTRKVFILSVRIPYEGEGRFKWAVECKECPKVLGQSEKNFEINNDGTVTKRKMLAYEVDHIDGNHELTEIKDHLGKYAQTLFFGELQILCRTCHKKKTRLAIKT